MASPVSGMRRSLRGFAMATDLFAFVVLAAYAGFALSQ
jgi:hypothetical protein